MVLLAFMSGVKLEGNNLGPLLFKRLTIKGSTLRSRSVEYQQELLQHFKNEALDKIVNGEMRIEVHEVFPWDKVADAHKEMEANKNSGKVRVLLDTSLTSDRIRSHRSVVIIMHFINRDEHPKHP
jgi:NADPH:quinone reductase-like Zn-dependent oxidoreductase